MKHLALILPLALGAGLIACDDSAGGDPVPAPIADLPRIHDHSGASPARTEALVRRALEGLGMDAERGPSPNDRVFVGRHVMAWIDETGFVGKLNGLWALDGAAGDALDFVLVDDGRPVNMLVPGENGRGGWPAGYPGGEHIEFPNRVPEADDDPRCAERDWCNQYGVSEAAPITDGDIPWWSSCNAGKPAWDARFEPVEVSERDGRLVLWYRAPLVKVADGDGRWDADSCHQDYLFDDGVRRRVWLRLGWQFEAGSSHLERLVQVENPAGNPPFDGPMSFIGGFVMTRWPDPHPLKQLHRYWRPEERDARVSWGDREVPLPAGRWTDLTGQPVMRDRDAIIAWAGQPLSFSSQPAYAEGRAFTLAHVGPSDNDDVGACLCAVHGGLELGGGLIHGGISLPLAGGARTPVARRRLSLRRDVPSPRPRLIRYAADGPALRHQIGRAEGRAFTLAHVGPSDNDDVGACLCAVHGGLELGGGLIHGGISLPLAGGARTPVARRRLSLRRDVPAPRPRLVRYAADGPALRHQIGRAEAGGWSANTADDMPGHLVFGPYARDWGDGRATVTFRMMVDVVEAADDEVVRVDVFDADAGEVLAEAGVQRSAFPGPFAWHEVTLDVDLAGRAGRAMETRIWWTDRSYVRVDAIEVRTE